MSQLRAGLAVLAGLGIAALLYYGYTVLTAEPCLGVADILDFARVAQPAGIEHLTPLEAPGYYTRCEMQTTEADFAAAPSSAAALAWSAKLMRFLGPAGEGRFALRQMGLLCFFLAACFLAAGLAWGLRPVLALLLLYVLVDPGYLLFFNSFYADGALFLALFGTVICFDRLGDLPRPKLESRRNWIAALAILALLLMLGGGSKMLFVLLPAVVITALLPLFPRLWREAPKRAAALAILVAAIQALVFWNFFFGAGPRFLEYNNFHAVYGGILKVSTRPEQVFESLGIPAEHREIPREDAWTAGVGIDHPVHAHLRDLSRLQLLRFYLADPQALRATLAKIADDLLLVASHPRGVYPRQENDRHPVKRIYGESWQFSNLTRIAYNGWRPAILLLLLAPSAWILAAALRGRWTAASATMFFLLLWFFSQCALAVLGEGFINLHQHLVGARLALDFLLVVFLVEVGRTSAARFRRV
jgi:hypothetical protein